MWTVFGVLLMEIEYHVKCVENMLIYGCLNILVGMDVNYVCLI